MKFSIEDKIKIIDKYGDTVYGHIVVIISTETGYEYYCSMYPGALGGYYWVYCIDSLYPEDGRQQALNKFYETDLEHSDIKKHRQLKLKKIDGK